ncbi:MAG: phosphate acyltransferase, partial [Acidimicrobiales bacterium]
MGILDDWYERAAAAPRRIVLADDDPRAHEAAARLRNDGLAEPVVIGRDLASVADAAHPEADELVARLAAVTDGPWAGRPLDIDDPLTIATALVKSGWADGAVAGATRPTGDVIRAGIRVLDVAPDVSVVSSSFFFVLPDGRPLV